MAKKYSDSELSALLDKELRQSLGSPTSEIAHLRLRNLQYYKADATGELAPPSIPDRSQIVATDVADTVNWMLPSLVRVFAASPDAVECVPTHPRFAPQAKLASEYMRHCFWKKNSGFSVVNGWFKDALIQKVGFVKVFWEESTQDIEESYDDLLPEQVEMILAEGDEVEVIEQEAHTELVEGQPVEMYDIRIKRAKKDDKCIVLNVPPEEMRLHPRARYGEEPLFVAQQFYRTRGELEADGYDLTNVSTEDGWHIEEIERANTQTPFFYDSSDGELQRYRVSECYIKLDQDSDGIPEWLRVLMIGKTILEQEKVPDHPFVWFCPDPLPHTFFGQCPADFAIEPQRLRTSLMRALLDNVYLSVNQRTQVIEGQVNLDDLLMSRPGGIVRTKMAGAMTPVPQNGLDPSAWQMVEWAEQWRETRTGYTRYSQGLSPDALNPTATGVNIITEKADQRVELIARVAAESVKQLFAKMLACMCRYQEVEEVVELMGQWTPIDPREWSDGYQIEVTAGLGTGSKDKKAMVMQQVMQMQAPLVQGGVIPPQAAILAARKFLDAAGVQGAEELFPDAQPPQPQANPEAMKMQAEQAKHQAQMQADAMAKQADMQLERDRMQMQAQVDSHRQQVESEQKNLEQSQQLQLEKYKADRQAEVEASRLEFERWKAQLASDTQIYLEQLKQAQAAPIQGGADGGDALHQAITAMTEAVAQLSRPKQIIRDANGRAQGIA
jgi:hypothetical protein